MIKLVQGSIVILCLSLATLAIFGVYEVKTIGVKSRELIATSNDTMINLREASKSLGDYADFEVKELQSNKSQKAIEHSLQMGEAGLLTLQKIDRTTIPKINNMVDVSTLTIAKLQEPTEALTKLVGVVTNQLMPEVVDVLQKLGSSEDEILSAIKSANLTIKDLDNIVNNKDIPLIIEGLKNSSIHFNNITGEFEGASKSFNEGLKKFPSLMDNFEKYSKASTTWQKRLYLAMIIRQLAAIPLRLP